MSNLDKAFAWTERDAYKHEEVLLDVTKEFVDVRQQAAGVKIEVTVSPHDLRAALSQAGYEIDHMEALALQEIVIQEMEDGLVQDQIRAEGYRPTSSSLPLEGVMDILGIRNPLSINEIGLRK